MDVLDVRIVDNGKVRRVLWCEWMIRHAILC